MTNRRSTTKTPPQTRKITGKVVPFVTDLAADLLSLNSLDHVIDSLAFWIRQMKRMSCPECGITGSIIFNDEPYGVRIYCIREQCEYIHEQLYFGKA